MKRKSNAIESEVVLRKPVQSAAISTTTNDSNPSPAWAEESENEENF